MRPTKIQINTANLLHNINTIKNRANCELIPVVKANAYGHGLTLVSKILRQNETKKIAVAFCSEAKELRISGDTGEILLLVPPGPTDAKEIVEYDFESSISDLDTLLEIDNLAKKNNKIINLHLFINTGMNRDGISPEEALAFLQKSSELKNVNILGIMTHLPDTEFSLENNRLSDKCLKIFEKLLYSLKIAGFDFKEAKEIHTFNTAGIINLKSEWANIARTGIGIYGILPSIELENKINLKPVLSLKSKIISIKIVKQNETVGYSQKYFSDKDSRIAIVPIGYGDGYSAMLSNSGQCLISGKRYNIVGSVCMDQLMLDIGFDEINVGDEVVLIGKSGDDEISVYELSDKIGTIPYEILTMFSARIPRELLWKETL
jgi:alanine racemase